MRLTRYTHACVRIEQGGRVVVIDPGSYSEVETALAGAHDLLVTHEHADHIEIDRVAALLAAPGSPAVHTVAPVAELLADRGVEAHVVAPGDRFEAGGLEVEVFGGQHAEIYDGLPGCANVGFLLGGLYYPGDALHVPDADVQTLLLPVGAPWLKLREAIDFVRAVAPERAHPVHDALLSDVGQAGVDRWLLERGGTAYARVAPGESVSLP